MGLTEHPMSTLRTSCLMPVCSNARKRFTKSSLSDDEYPVHHPFAESRHFFQIHSLVKQLLVMFVDDLCSATVYVGTHNAIICIDYDGSGYVGSGNFNRQHTAIPC